MVRAALSASRGIDILELLGTFPEKQFTLSEISRATGINVSSCHQILTTLLDRGYLTRLPGRKTFSLGPSMVGLGQAALIGQPLIARASAAAEYLAAKLDVPALLTTAKVDQVLAVSAAPDSAGRMPSVRVGERYPLIAPMGEEFLAWSTEKRFQTWIERRDVPADAAQIARWRHGFDLMRSRGYHLTLRSSMSARMSAIMHDLSASGEIENYRERLAHLITELDDGPPQPETIEPDEQYQVLFISVPLLDRERQAAFTLALGEFSQKLTGSMIVDYAEQLMEAAMDVMRPDTPIRKWKDASRD